MWRLVLAVALGGCVDSYISVTVDGTGAVTSKPQGIDCKSTGGTCAMWVDPSVSVELTAITPAVGSDFASWGGACAGTGACLVEATNDREVTALFVDATERIHVTTTGLGGFTVTSEPAGITCGTGGQRACAIDVPTRTDVTLSARYADPGSFLGWSGEPACTAGTTCTVHVDRFREIGAMFDLPLTLDVNVTGPGTVTGPGIHCPGMCHALLPRGTPVTLHPSPDAGARFDGWLGICPGQTDCSFALQYTATVSATFVAE